MEKIKLIPKLKNWVGEEYEDALLMGFGRDKNLILLTKRKGKKRSKTKSSWTPRFWKIG